MTDKTTDTRSQTKKEQDVRDMAATIRGGLRLIASADDRLKVAFDQVEGAVDKVLDKVQEDAVSIQKHIGEIIAGFKIPEFDSASIFSDDFFMGDAPKTEKETQQAVSTLDEDARYALRTLAFQGQTFQIINGHILMMDDSREGKPNKLLLDLNVVAPVGN